MKHGFVEDKVLVKSGKQVIKFWKHNGYAVKESDLEQVRGVTLLTKYDGKLYARRDKFYQHGIPNDFKGEKQIVLPIQHWEVIK